MDTTARIPPGFGAWPLDPRDVIPRTLEAASIKRHWLQAAYERAGIDPSAWDTSRALDAASGQVVHAVPAYYAKLYGIDPAYSWAGMASMIAPSFVAGMEDAHRAAELLTRAERTLDRIPLLGGGLSALPAYFAERSTRLETRLMKMQREIFEDQAVMHEAYLSDGMAGIRRLRDVELIDNHAYEAWRLLDAGRRTGRSDLVFAANQALLRREQLQVIEDDYDIMREANSGRIATFGLSNAGRNAIPGVEPLWRYRPSGLAHMFGIPLASPDLSHRDDRWDYIEHRVFPRWKELATTHPALVAAMISRDTATRIADEDLRLLPGGDR